MAFIDDLNPAQQQAVLYNDGPHLVVAGAGSGKTRVLTYKVAYLLSQGVPPSRILALTFTNKAANEMKERIGRLVGEDKARYVTMGTFHSVCARILRQESALLGYPHDFTIYDTTDSKSALKQIIKDLGEDEKIYKVGDVLGKISDAKNNLIDWREYAQTKEFGERDRRQRHYLMAEIYRVYQQRLRASAAMDFDDLLFNMNILLQTQPEVLEKYQRVFQYILVDEYQDTNYSQYLIVKRLAEPNRNICVVGDDAQSIYGFRGADIRNILMFQHEYKDCPVFKLEQNYRSTQNITNAANSLIHHNQNQIRKDVYSKNDVGEPVHLSSYSTDREEAHGIVSRISRLHGSQRRSYNDIAVLYRTNAQSRVLEDELRKNTIPYSIYGGLSFYQRKEIKDALAFFRIAVNPFDNEAMNRAVGLTHGVGETTMKHIRLAANTNNVSYYEVIREPDKYPLDVSTATMKKIAMLASQVEQYRVLAEENEAYTFATEVMSRSGIMMSALTDKSPDGLERLENLKELQSAIHEFVENNSTNDNMVRIHDFLSEVALLTDQDTQQNDDTARVRLMTIHSAKGLEFGVVFIAGLEENLFPSGFVQSEHELEEERRLFYVAITRAKEVCYITSARSRFRNGQVTMQTPSRFIKEIDSAFTETSNSAPTGVSRFARYGDDFFAPNLSSRWQQESPADKIGGTTERHRDAAIGQLFQKGDRIEHSVFGVGTILEVYSENGNDKVDVRFDKSGKKTLLLKFAKLKKQSE